MLSSPRRAPLALLWVAVVVLLMSSLAQSDDGELDRGSATVSATLLYVSFT